MKKSVFILFLSVVAVSASVGTSNSQYTITQLTYNAYDDQYPQISNSGYVAWGSDALYEIFLFDGTSITQITDSPFNDAHPQINNNGYVIWGGGNDNWDNTEVFLFNGTSTSQITDSFYHEYSSEINNNGTIVWYGRDGGGGGGCFVGSSGK